MAGWISLIAGFAAPIATAALVFGEYLCETPEATTSARLVATFWIVACGIFHGINLRTGSWINNAVVVVKLVGFAIFAIACARFLLGLGKETTFQPALHASLFQTDYLAKLFDSGILVAILVQLFFISLSYTGFNASIYIAEELHDRADPRDSEDRPALIVPRSMILACVMVTLIYLGLNTLFLACDTQESIVAGRDYFVSDVAFRVGGDALRWVMRITIALSSATSVLAMMATGPRVYAQMARDGWLPRWLGPQGEVPRGALVVQALASGLIVWLADVLQLVSYLGLTLTACGAVATSTLWIAYREMNRRLPVQWWEHAALAAYIAGALLLLAAAWWVKPEQFWLCIASFAVGIVLFALARVRQRVG
jgi:APA family basic amino acid/polyamine antiporter